ncbi:hypothetical protein CAI21_15720 [Alkalilimnicola ehrlichii]|uniref:Big-1 domain-containing protein n=1 Tax=Alkalilimnicola ehrlichii TaxID=351052 RepID=A0A3E0WPN5_9GAMM|nr:hypothetical protein [Alkalilimnicola ehrlichii]RFA27000.1 hypothetical protein CAI21_15720 [Alkalilimnicola ehrlichii]RFA34121.1 hypothetical protein CAL65_15855 [Alkalilimnicola ehrlichii]
MRSILYPLLFGFLLATLVGCSGSSDNDNDPPDNNDPDDSQDIDDDNGGSNPIGVSTGDPANITIDVANHHVFAMGRGEVAQTNLAIEVTDSRGASIDERGYNNRSLNNLRVTVVNAPHGGEYFSGRNAAGEIVQTSLSQPSIDIRTEGGSASLSFQAGTLPGMVEVKIEALRNRNGGQLSKPVVATAPIISIASAEAHTVHIIWRQLSAVQDVNNAVYRRVGKVKVTDRYGYPVKNAIVHLGLIDTVLSYGNDGQVAYGDQDYFHTNNPFFGDFITPLIRDNMQLYPIDSGSGKGSRLLIKDTPIPGDRNRILVEAFGPNTGRVNREFGDYTSNQFLIDGASNLRWWLGVSETGGSVTGADGLPGTVITDNEGEGEFYVSYPATPRTIHLGCIAGSYGHDEPYDLYYYDEEGRYHSFDIRYREPESAQVILVAEVSGNPETGARAVRVDPSICFSSIIGWSLTASETQLMGTETHHVRLRLVDGGAEVPLPLEPINVGIEKSRDDLEVEIEYHPIVGRGLRTDLYGGAWVSLTATNGRPGDRAQVTFSASRDNDASVTVTIEVR